MLVLVSWMQYPRGDTRSIHGGWGGGGRGGPTELHIANPKKYISLKFYTQKNTWHQNFQPKKLQDLKTSVLIYSIKQTLRPKNIRGKSLDPKKSRECKFSIRRTPHPPPSCSLRVTPPPGRNIHASILELVCMLLPFFENIVDRCPN